MWECKPFFHMTAATCLLLPSGNYSERTLTQVWEEVPTGSDWKFLNTKTFSTQRLQWGICQLPLRDFPYRKCTKNKGWRGAGGRKPQGNLCVAESFCCQPCNPWCASLSCCLILTCPKCKSPTFLSTSPWQVDKDRATVNGLEKKLYKKALAG